METKVYWTKTVEIIRIDNCFEDGVYLASEDGETYDLEDFIRSDGEYDAVAGMTNTSALAVNLDPDGETGTLYCIG